MSVGSNILGANVFAYLGVSSLTGPVGYVFLFGEYGL